MQGVLCLLPQQQLDEMEVKTTTTTTTTTTDDSGIFSATSNTTFADRTHSSEEVEEAEEDVRKYMCPICETLLHTQHAFTLHIRSHNNHEASGGGGGGALARPVDEVVRSGFTCRICAKVLSSSSSLDRHVLVHSGERPFTCRHCGDTFTTNGNMHRHMRTHTTTTTKPSDAGSYESDASVESTASSGGSKTGGGGGVIEFNNNKVDSKRKLDANTNASDDDDEENDDEPDDDDVEYQVRKKAHLESTPPLPPPAEAVPAGGRRCPVCARDDFTSRRSLEVHVEDNHPDYPAKCHKCKQMFHNQKRLNYHKMTVHADADANGRHRGAIVHGFKHIDFVDFSSAKFPLIARHECEKTFHKATGGGARTFVCARCSRAFPCGKSLESHATECGTVPGGVRGVANSASTIMRDEFFHRLDLEDKQQQRQRAALLQQQHAAFDAATAATKDLADIPSIISMTKGCFLQQLHAADTGGIIGEQRTEEEESQDVFAVEFRKMKLRGEFPCRLCASVFPNLRALKGHNRTHLNAAHSGTYRCNMCPHASLDKAALIRHMRTHNGDRPYECALCNYAFTTKANCERHLRNRHAKSTRDEVKRSIIYHPSEDPTNEDIVKQVEAKKQHHQQQLNTSANSIDSSDLNLPARSSTPKSVVGGISAVFTDAATHLNKDLSMAMFSALTPKPAPPPPPPPPTIETQPTPHIRVKDVNVLKQIPEVPLDTDAADEDDDEEEEDDDNDDDDDGDDEEMSEEPMDLSKKKDDELTTTPPPPQPAAPHHFPISELLTQQLLKTAAPPPPASTDPSLSLYAHLATLCRGGFPNYFPGFPINPLMMPPVHADTQEMRDRLQRQLTGGGIKGGVYAPHNYFFGDVKLEGGGTPKPAEDDVEPLSVRVDNFTDQQQQQQQPMKASPILSTPKSEHLQSPNSVKMVIKNGVLMPKQKQRRYRTERPFSCEHCAARFTLRSNMERHIKQQHPQYWSQRQRAASMGTPGRKPPQQQQPPPSPIPLMPPAINVPMPSFDAPPDEAANTTRNAISEKLKYAILSQHLRAAHEVKKEEPHHQVEDDHALVIDEVPSADEQQPPPPRSEITPKSRILEEKLKELRDKQNEQQLAAKKRHEDAVQDLVSVSRLLVNASQQQHQLKEYFRPADPVEELNDVNSEEDEEGLVASGSTSEGNSGSEENRSESDSVANPPEKKKSAYSLAPNRVSCPYCSRKFPWTSSLRRHILTHTGQKPFKCSHCPLLFTTKSNCDRHLLRKHGNAATTISNSESASNNFMMRNVPERPFKCATCPSSTFSTYSNLKKHMISKHGAHDDRQGYEAGSSEDEKNVISDHQQRASDWEAQIAPHAKPPAATPTPLPAVVALPPENNTQTTPPNSDLPFKCHLCDSSFGERQECLDHIRHRHASEYDLLMSKNALDPNATTPDDSNAHDDDDKETGESCTGVVRGKFPDYSNRKVICAFCMRRFWSAEDLRRHMRTHTGERPFSCDICRRRFTLKHSMLRHRKKHNLAFDADANQSDEEVGFELKQKPVMVIKEEKRDERDEERERDDSDVNDGSDLISNLLGIRDRSLIDQVLTASADDAAKLLGVGN